MADVTISGLAPSTPSKDTAIIPFSDGSNTYKTSPSGIVAASPGCILQVKQVVKTSVNNVQQNPLNTYVEVDTAFRQSIAPTSINNRFLHQLSITGGTVTATPRFLIQHSINGGANWLNTAPVSLAPAGTDGGSGSTYNGGSRQPAHFFFNINTDPNLIWTVSFNMVQDALSSMNNHLYRVLIGGDQVDLFYWNRSKNYNNSFLGSRGISTWIIQEIAG